MLESIRSNTQSLGVKIAFGVIILVFVFWGIGSITDTGSINVVGMVNEQPITFQQYEMAYRRAEEAASRNNPRAKWTDEEKSQLGKQVFNSLVSDMLITQEAEKNHISVSPFELRKIVDGIPAFQNEKGKFDPEVYKRVLNQQRQTPAQFEDTLRRQLLEEKVMAFVSGGVWSDPSEPRNRFNFLRQRRVIEYVYVSNAESAKAYTPTDEECNTFYTEHKNDYAVPHKAEIKYITVDPATLVKPESITDEEIKKWYDSHTSRFVEPKKVNVSHILVMVPQDASEADVKAAEATVAAIQKELSSGKPFEQVADSHNSPQAAGKGGSVGWIEPGATVPEFEKVAFETPKGQISAPVRSQFGFHIIRVNDVNEGGQKALAEVSNDIRTMLAQDKSKSSVNEVLDALIEDNILGKPLDQSAAKFGLAVQDSGMLSQQEMQQKLSLKPEAAAHIQTLAVDQPVDTPLEAGETYLIARVTGTEAATFRTFADVRADIVSRMRADKGTAAGTALLQDMLKGISNGALPAAWKNKVATSEPTTRDSAFAPFEAQPELSDAVFSASIGNWVDKIYPVKTKDTSGVVAFRVAKVISPDDAEWKQFENIMVSLSQRERSEGLYQAFMQDLASRSTVRVLNQNAINRTNM